MADYGVLADRLFDSVQAGNPAGKRLVRNGFDPAAFYESVTRQVEEEVGKANVELRKRGLTTIERVFIPGYLGRLCLTFGTALLLSVELQAAKGRIKAVIFVPPNRCEISRKEYLMGRQSLRSQDDGSNEQGKIAVDYDPDRIAAEIVSGLLMGEFA
jgi:hypothetical protein